MLQFKSKIDGNTLNQYLGFLPTQKRHDFGTRNIYYHADTVPFLMSFLFEISVGRL